MGPTCVTLARSELPMNRYLFASCWHSKKCRFFCVFSTPDVGNYKIVQYNNELWEFSVRASGSNSLHCFICSSKDFTNNSPNVKNKKRARYRIGRHFKHLEATARWSCRFRGPGGRGPAQNVNAPRPSHGCYSEPHTQLVSRCPPTCKRDIVCEILLPVREERLSQI